MDFPGTIVKDDDFPGQVVGQGDSDFPGEVVAPAPAPVAPPSSKLRRAVGDPLVSLSKGIVSVPEGIVGLANIPTLGYAGKAAESVGVKFKETKDILGNLYSPEAKRAQENVSAGFDKGIIPGVKSVFENPSTIVSGAIESTPGMLGGGAIAKGLMKAPAVISMGSKIAPVVAGAIGEGLVTIGQNTEQTRQETASGTLTPKQTGISAASGALTGALGVLGGRAAKWLKVSDIDTLMASGVNQATKRGILMKLFGGAVSEGLFEELPQSIQEQVAQNLALNKPWSEGVAQSGAMGAIIGGIMGAGANLVKGKPDQQPQQPPVPQPAQTPPQAVQPAAPAPSPVLGPVQPVAAIPEPAMPALKGRIAKSEHDMRVAEIERLMNQPPEVTQKALADRIQAQREKNRAEWFAQAQASLQAAGVENPSPAAVQAVADQIEASAPPISDSPSLAAVESSVISADAPASSTASDSGRGAEPSSTSPRTQVSLAKESQTQPTIKAPDAVEPISPPAPAAKPNKQPSADTGLKSDRGNGGDVTKIRVVKVRGNTTDVRMPDGKVVTYSEKRDVALKMAQEDYAKQAVSPPQSTPRTPESTVDKGAVVVTVADIDGAANRRKRDDLMMAKGQYHAPGLRLSDQETAGSMAYLVEKGQATMQEWNDWVIQARKENRFTDLDAPVRPPNLADRPSGETVTAQSPKVKPAQSTEKPLLRLTGSKYAGPGVDGQKNAAQLGSRIAILRGLNRATNAYPGETFDLIDPNQIDEVMGYMIELQRKEKVSEKPEPATDSPPLPLHEALNAGTAKVPKGATFVQVNGSQVVSTKDVDTLKGAGPFKSAKWGVKGKSGFIPLMTPEIRREETKRKVQAVREKGKKSTPVEEPKRKPVPIASDVLAALKKIEPYETVMSGSAETSFMVKARKVLGDMGIEEWKVNDAYTQIKRERAKTSNGRITYVGARELTMGLIRTGDATESPPVAPATTPVEPVKEEPAQSVKNAIVPRVGDDVTWTDPTGHAARGTIESIHEPYEGQTGPQARIDYFGMKDIPLSTLTVKRSPQGEREAFKARSEANAAAEEKVRMERQKNGNVKVSVPSKDKPGLPMKEQKKYLLAEIDKAIEGASDENPITSPMGSDQRGAQRLNTETFGTVTIEVPNDGTFKVLNSKPALEAFKKSVKSQFPAKVHEQSEPKATPKQDKQTRESKGMQDAVSLYGSERKAVEVLTRQLDSDAIKDDADMVEQTERVVTLLQQGHRVQENPSASIGKKKAKRTFRFTGDDAVMFGKVLGREPEPARRGGMGTLTPERLNVSQDEVTQLAKDGYFIELIREQGGVDVNANRELFGENVVPSLAESKDDPSPQFRDDKEGAGNETATDGVDIPLRAEVSREYMRLSEADTKAKVIIRRVLGPNANVEIVDRLFERGASRLGKYQSGLVTIARKGDMNRTAWHEAYHGAEDMLFTEEERNRAVRLEPDAEKRADAFMEYAAKNDSFTGKMKALFDRLMYRIKALFGKANGIDELKALHGRLMGGEMAGRNQEMSGEMAPAYSGNESGETDEITGIRTYITGRRVEKEDSTRIYQQSAMRFLGVVGAMLRVGNAPYDVLRAQAKKAGVSFFPSEKDFVASGNLRLVGSGSEARVYKPDNADVVYKVLVNDMGTIGSVFNAVVTSDGKLAFDESRGNAIAVLTRILASNSLGFTPTEIAGITGDGDVILKQPYAESLKGGRLESQQAISRAIPVPSSKLKYPDSPIWIASESGKPVLITDIADENSLTDTSGRGRIGDASIVPLSDEIITALGIRKEVDQALALERENSASRSDESFRTARSSVVTPEQDKAYMDAVERGDTETAQRMVDEAAKAAGYNVGPVYHGTDKNFNKFATIRDARTGRTRDPNAFIGSHFAASIEPARRFSEGLYSDSKDGNGRIVSAFLKITKPLQVGKGGLDAATQASLEADIQAARAKYDAYATERNKRPNDALERAVLSGDKDAIDAALKDETGEALHNLGSQAYYALSMAKESNRPVTESEIYSIAGLDRDAVFAEWERRKSSPNFARSVGRKIRNALIAAGHDGVFYENAIEAETGLAGDRRTYIALFPEQIKSADPITRDDQGRVIPLSERFNEASDDIRYRTDPEELTKESLLSSIDRVKRLAKKAQAKIQDDALVSDESYNDLVSDLSDAVKSMHAKAIAEGGRDVMAQQKQVYLAMKQAIPVSARGRMIPYLLKVKNAETAEAALDKLQEATEAWHKFTLISYINKQRQKIADSGVIHIDSKDEARDLLKGMNVQDLTVEQLASIAERIKKIGKYGRAKFASQEDDIAARKKANIAELQGQSGGIAYDEMELKTSGQGGVTDLDWSDKALNVAKKWGNIVRSIYWSGSGNDRLFDQLDGFKNGKGVNTRIFKVPLDLKENIYEKEIRPIISGIMDIVKKHDLTTESVRKIGVFAAANQEGGMEKLANLGFDDQRQVQAIVEEVKASPGMMEFYNYARSHFDSIKPRIRKVLRGSYNVDMKEVENYFSFMTDWALTDDADTSMFVNTVDADGLPTGYQLDTSANLKINATKNFAKARAAAGKQKINIDALYVFTKRIQDMYWFANMAAETKYLGELANSKEYRAVAGKAGQKLVRQYIDIMARRGGTTGVHNIRQLDELINNLGVGTLGFRLSTIAIQPTSLVNAMGVIGHRAVTGFAQMLDPAMRKFVYDNMPEVVSGAGKDIFVREVKESIGARKLKEAGMGPMVFMDKITRGGVALGAYRKYLADRGIAFDAANPNQDAIQYAQRIARQTQATGHFKDAPLLMTRGMLMNSKTLTRAIMQFQTYPMNNFYFMVNDGLRTAIANKDYAKLASIIAATQGAFLVEGLVREAIRSLPMAGGRSDDDDRKSLEELLASNQIRNAIGQIPIVGAWINSAKYGSFPAPVMEAFRSVSAGAISATTAKSPESRMRGAVRASGAAGSLLGIPGTSQVSQSIRGMIKTDSEEVADTVRERAGRLAAKDANRGKVRTEALRLYRELNREKKLKVGTRPSQFIRRFEDAYKRAKE